MTDWGTARRVAVVIEEVPLVVSPPGGAGVPFVDFLPFTSAEVPLVAEEPGGGARAVSCRTSSITRRRRAGKVVASPERRRDKAWFCTAVGQLVGCAFREWRRASWILEGGKKRGVTWLAGV